MFPLVEIFESLQGEGRNMGRPVVFVRFATCNLACPWCDTCVETRFTLSQDDLLKEISSFSKKSVILTGGEPTIQEGMDALVEELKARGFWVGVETNGTRDVPWLKKADYVACSPKAEFPEALRLREANEVRLVASSLDVLPFARRIRREIKADDYYISPCERGGTMDFATAKAVLQELDGFSLSVQLHKILGFR